MRIVRVGQDLSGQTLDASGQPEGHARESLIQGCDISGATFMGDIRGSTFLGNTGAADWSQARTFACYWRGNPNLSGSQWPADIGHLHHQPVGTIIRDRVALLDSKAQGAVRNVADFVLSGDYATASWDTSKGRWWDGATVAQRDKLIAAFRRVFEPYPKLTQRFEELLRSLKEGGSLFTGASLSCKVVWPDGAEVTVDALSLPPLPDASAYSLARWVEIQADAQRTGPHHCFAYSIFPPVIQVLQEPDAWLRPEVGWAGY